VVGNNIFQPGSDKIVNTIHDIKEINHKKYIATTTHWLLAPLELYPHNMKVNNNNPDNEIIAGKVNEPSLPNIEIMPKNINNNNRLFITKCCISSIIYIYILFYK